MGFPFRGICVLQARMRDYEPTPPAVCAAVWLVSWEGNLKSPIGRARSPSCDRTTVKRLFASLAARKRKAPSHDDAGLLDSCASAVGIPTVRHFRRDRRASSSQVEVSGVAVSVVAVPPFALQDAALTVSLPAVAAAAQDAQAPALAAEKKSLDSAWAEAGVEPQAARRGDSASRSAGSDVQAAG
jgi:hypothetical protein